MSLFLYSEPVYNTQKEISETLQCTSRLRNFQFKLKIQFLTPFVEIKN